MGHLLFGVLISTQPTSSFFLCSAADCITPSGTWARSYSKWSGQLQHVSDQSMPSHLRRLLPPRKRHEEGTAAVAKSELQQAATQVDESTPCRANTTPTSTAQHLEAAREPSMSPSSHSRPPSPARVFPSSGFHQFSRSRRVDEEN